MNGSSVYTVGPFTVTSYGRGSAYEVRLGSKSFFVQGDSALQFEQDTGGVSDPERVADYFDALATEDP